MTQDGADHCQRQKEQPVACRIGIKRCATGQAGHHQHQGAAAVGDEGVGRQADPAPQPASMITTPSRLMPSRRSIFSNTRTSRFLKSHRLKEPSMLLISELFISLTPFSIIAITVTA